MRICLDVPEEALARMLGGVTIPPMAHIRYDMPTPPAVDDVAAALHTQLAESGASELITRGNRVAVGVGSRGIDRLPDIVAALVSELRALGANPFVIPTMGSHGGATDIGQREVLEYLGVTPERVGAPVVSSMDTVELGRTSDGTVVYLDRQAANADGIVFVARVKPHTAFRGPYESGLAKMITIGLGKQVGAASAHAQGFGEMARLVPQMAEIALARAPIRFAIAVIENAYDRICMLRVVPAAGMLAEEPALLDEARRAMPRIPFPELDVLVIDEIGKNISGDGADPNVTGRYPTPFASGGPCVTRQVVLDLATASGGNANGIGTADFTTARLARKLDLAHTYPNALTSTIPGPVKLPMVLPSDRLAFAAAISTCMAVGREPRVMRIRNTLQLHEFSVSPSLLDRVYADHDQQMLEAPRPLTFDATGNLPELGG